MNPPRLRMKYNYIAMVPQWDFLDLLARAGAPEPAFTLRMNTEATGFLREGGRKLYTLSAKEQTWQILFLPYQNHVLPTPTQTPDPDSTLVILTQTP